MATEPNSAAPDLPPTAPPSSLHRPGTIIAGRYKLLEEIGEGGMGTVWLAEQSEPVRRRVAIKLIKAGMDSRQVVSRFAAERQALALMDHPNIAKVFDGGMTDEGRPFFVMEYVKGLRITQYCDDACLSILQRLELMVQVCQAVQHAHQKGVIHRDLKPSNILVCLYDGEPVPKVIDFGLAKAIYQPLTEHTLYTAHGLMVGTPLYMSPEQSELNNLDVDTRTDIYSLGVLLYELLTGSTPLERHELHEAALQEVVRLIKEKEPPMPSKRLSSSANLATIASKRKAEAVQLNRSIRGDLDWITMKALEKDRSRRYETANGLARDIERYLNDEPVEAGPPSVTYRLRKLSHKYRRPLISIGIVAMLLVFGTAVSTWQAVRATRAEALARVSEERARSSAAAAEEAAAAETTARKEAQAAAKSKSEALAAQEVATAAERLAKVEAETRGREAEQARASEAEARAAEEQARKRAEAIVRFLLNTFESPDPRREGRTITVAEMLDRAANDLKEKLNDSWPIKASLLSTIASTYLGLGLYKEAIPLLEQVHERRLTALGQEHSLTLDTQHNLAVAYQAAGRLDKALQLQQQTYDIRLAQLGPDDPLTLNAANNLSNAYGQAGQHEKSLALCEDTLRRRRAVHGEEDPQTLKSMVNVALGHQSMGRFDKAAPLLEQSLELSRKVLGPEHLETLATASNLSAIYLMTRRFSKAAELLESILPLHRMKLGNEHPRALLTMYGLGEAYYGLRKLDKAEAFLRECLEICQRTRPDEWRTFVVQQRLGIVLLDQFRFVEAGPHLVSGYQGLSARMESIPQTAHDPMIEVIRLLKLLYPTPKNHEMGPESSNDSERNQAAANDKLNQ